MKILMISPQPFFEPRGTPISVYQRLEALSALGHEIDLVTYRVGTDVEFPNVKIHRVRQVKAIPQLRPFQGYRIVPERSPVKTKLHTGWKTHLFNNVCVGAFNLMPKPWVRPFGWHLMVLP